MRRAAGERSGTGMAGRGSAAAAQASAAAHGRRTAIAAANSHVRQHLKSPVHVTTLASYVLVMRH